jgi:hypothetical protein
MHKESRNCDVLDCGVMEINDSNLVQRATSSSMLSQGVDVMASFIENHTSCDDDCSILLNDFHSYLGQTLGESKFVMCSEVYAALHSYTRFSLFLTIEETEQKRQKLVNGLEKRVGSVEELAEIFRGSCGHEELLQCMAKLSLVLQVHLVGFQQSTFFRDYQTKQMEHASQMSWSMVVENHKLNSGMFRNKASTSPFLLVPARIALLLSPFPRPDSIVIVTFSVRSYIRSSVLPPIRPVSPSFRPRSRPSVFPLLLPCFFLSLCRPLLLPLFLA